MMYEGWIKVNEELIIWESNTSKACWPVILGELYVWPYNRMADSHHQRKHFALL